MGRCAFRKSFNGKDKLFFMANYEVVPPAAEISKFSYTVPTAAMFERRFQRALAQASFTIPTAKRRFPGNIIPAQSHRPDLEEVAAVLPACQHRHGQLSNNY